MIMEEIMIPRDPQILIFIDLQMLLKNLKHEIKSIKKSNESLADNKIQ